MSLNTALAQAPGVAETSAFVDKVNEIILFPLITLLFAIALLYFVYGAVIFIMNAGNPSARETGRNHIIFSIIGMLVMLMAYAILSIAANTVGTGKELDCSKNPSASGCDFIFMPFEGTGTGNTGGSGTGNNGGTGTGNTGGSGTGNQN